MRVIRFFPCVLGAVILSMTFSQTVQAKYCPKCVKIESERSAEQAKKGPQKEIYYDDFLNGTEEEVSTSSGKERLESNQHTYHALSTSLLFALADAGSVHENQKETTSRERKDLFEQNGVQLKQGSPKTNEETVSTHKASSVDHISTMADVLTIRELFNTFQGPFTLFVPSDQAIQNLPPETFVNLLKEENRELLFALITNHIVPQQLLRANFNQPFKTLGGRIVELRTEGRELTVNGAKVIKSEPVGRSGVVYVIDQVFIPIYARE